MLSAYSHEQDERLSRMSRVIPGVVKFEPELPRLAPDGSYAEGGE